MSEWKSGWKWDFNSKKRTLERASRLIKEADQAYAAKTYVVALSLYRESLELWQELEEWQWVLWVRLRLGNIYFETQNYRMAQEQYEESVSIATDSHSSDYLVPALSRLAMVVSYLGDYSRARSLCEAYLQLVPNRKSPEVASFIYSLLGSIADSIGEAKAHYRRVLLLRRATGDNENIGATLCSLGHLASPDQDNQYERACLDECLTLCQVSGNQTSRSYALNNLGNIERFAGNWDRAAELYRESLRLKYEAQDEWAIAYTLEGCAALAVALHQGHKAARLFGAATGIRKRLGTPLEPSKQPEYSANVEAAGRLLTASDFESAWQEGEALPLDEAIAEAISE